MPKILISYRRDDSAAYAGRLADRLREHFGRDNVFVDIDTIRPGDDFVEAIERSLGSCTAVVALIGRNWLDLRDAAGQRRLDGNADYVRTEIAKALERHIRVIPVLVGDAAMPEAKDLPQDLVALTRRQAIELSDTRFHQDVDRLIEALVDTPASRTSQAPPRPMARGRTPAWLDRRWALAIVAVVLIGAAGYWLLSREDASSVESSLTPAERVNTPANDSRRAAGAAGRSGPASDAILKSSNNEPVDEREPNDDILHPNDLAFGTTVRAQIRPVPDKDFFRIRTPAGAVGEVRVVLSNRSRLVPEIEIWDRNFNSVTSKTKYERADLYHSFEAEPDTDYFVECRYVVSSRGFFADPKDSGNYELTVLFVPK